MAAERLKQVSTHIRPSGSRRLLEGEVAIITGAAQGIGRATAIAFAKEGAKLLITDIDETRLRNVESEIQELGCDVCSTAGDITDPHLPTELVEIAVAKWSKINHIVNNAGFGYGRAVHILTDELFRVMLDVHNVAPFRLLRAAAPHLRIKDPSKQENRSIVNVASTIGLHGNPGQANYATAKAGMIGLTKTMAKEWGAFGVRSNAVAPGYIVTRINSSNQTGETTTTAGQTYQVGLPPSFIAASDLATLATIPLARKGQPEEVASAILFLASPLASYISGHILEVAGGWMI